MIKEFVYQIPPGEVHPDYTFDLEIKKNVYDSLYRSLGSLKVRSVITFPELSNYRMERELELRYPGIKIYCFEKDDRKYQVIKDSFEKPACVELYNENVEDFLSGTQEKFDLMFFDYCGGPHSDLNDTIRDHLNVGGVYAQTRYLGGRGFEYPPIVDKFLKVVIKPVQYGHMIFEGFKKVSSEKDGVSLVEVQLNDWLRILEARRIKEQRVQKRIQRNGCNSKTTVALKEEIGRYWLGYKAVLPKMEQKTIKLYLSGKTQTEIARKLGLANNATVHFRLHKAVSRMKFAATRLKYTKEDLEAVDDLCGAREAKLFRLFYASTSYTAVARDMQKSYPLEGWTFTTVRHRLHGMREACRIILVPVYNILQEVMDNVYILHEVKLPHFAAVIKGRLDSRHRKEINEEAALL